MKRRQDKAFSDSDVQKNITLLVEQNKALQEDYTALLKENAQKDKKLQETEQKYLALKQQLDWMQRQLFGRKSERFVPEEDNVQPGLFEDISHEEPEAETQQVITTRKKKTKEQPGHARQPIPAHLPRKEEVIDEAPQGGKKIGEEITEILEYKPGQAWVRKIVRVKYVLPDQSITIPPLPDQPLPRSNAGASMLAYIIGSKYVDHLPLYRLMRMFEREGLSLSKTTVNDWVHNTINLLTPLYDRLAREVTATDYLMADETPIKVLDNEKKAETHRGYHWVYQDPVKKLVCFQYRKGRGREGPKEFLKDFEGAIQSDGYSVYDHIAKKKDLKLLACLAHVRRKFEQAEKNKPKMAEHALSRIKELYAIERRAKEESLAFDERKELREEEAAPIIRDMEAWMKEKILEVTPKSAIAKALAYALKLWDRISLYLEDGRYEIDNNMVENSIRPVALGRKNYLFAGSHDAAQRAAVIYSLFATCKKNDVNPLEWLEDVLNRLDEKPADLLPNRWVKSAKQLY